MTVENKKSEELKMTLKLCSERNQKWEWFAWNENQEVTSAPPHPLIAAYVNWYRCTCSVVRISPAGITLRYGYALNSHSLPAYQILHYALHFSDRMVCLYKYVRSFIEMKRHTFELQCHLAEQYSVDNVPELLELYSIPSRGFRITTRQCSALYVGILQSWYFCMSH